jgi:hypothetical protein
MRYVLCLAAAFGLMASPAAATDFGPPAAIAQIRHDVPILLGTRVDQRINSWELARQTGQTVCDLRSFVSAFTVADVVVVGDQAVVQWRDVCARGLVFLLRHGPLWEDTAEINPGIHLLTRWAIEPPGDLSTCEVGMNDAFATDALVSIVHFSRALARAAYASIGSVRDATNRPSIWRPLAKDIQAFGTRCDDTDALSRFSDGYAAVLHPIDDIPGTGAALFVASPAMHHRAQNQPPLVMVKIFDGAALGRASALSIWFPVPLDLSRSYELVLYSGSRTYRIPAALYDNTIHFVLPALPSTPIAGNVQVLTSRYPILHDAKFICLQKAVGAVFTRA